MKDLNLSGWGPEGTKSKEERNNHMDFLNNVDAEMEPVKEDEKDLFDVDFNEEEKTNKKEDLFEEDPFAENNDDVQQNASDDDFFGGNDNDKKDDDEENFSDDPFADNKEKEKTNKVKKANVEVEKGDIGDLFTKQLKIHIPDQNKDKNEDSSNEFRYFGELKDMDSVYQKKYNFYQYQKDYHKNLKKPIFESLFESKVTIPPQGSKNKPSIEDVNNKTLYENKIFNKISLYKFRNKALEAPLKLNLLEPGNYQKKNWNNKVEKAELVLDVEKKRRDMKYQLNYNMDNSYHNDIKNITDLNKKNKEERPQFEFPDQDKDKGQKQLKFEEEPINDTNDLDEVSSIDSDVIEEERKFKVKGGVFGNSGQNLNVSNKSSDMLQHAE